MIVLLGNSSSPIELLMLILVRTHDANSTLSDVFAQKSEESEDEFAIIRAAFSVQS